MSRLSKPKRALYSLSFWPKKLVMRIDFVIANQKSKFNQKFEIETRTSFLEIKLFFLTISRIAQFTRNENYALLPLYCA